MQRIKIDLTLDEPLILSPIIKSVEHTYSDEPKNGISILSYAYEEIFAEKVRALSQRLRPRDLYDVIHLYRNRSSETDQKLILKVLENKCRIRGIQRPVLETIEKHENRSFIESEWDSQLRHQLPMLPSFHVFLSELPNVLNWLEYGDSQSKGSQEDQNYSQLVSLVHEDERADIILESISDFIKKYTHIVIIDKIRFAASNRLLIEFTYHKELHRVEPYVFLRSYDGSLHIRGLIAQTTKFDTYQIEQIKHLTIIEETYIPKYKVEINSSSYVCIHQFKQLKQIT
jgi:hypothetical protein